MSQRLKRSRCGVSLTELLLLMSSCTIVLTMSTVLLHRVMRVQFDSRSFVDAERTSVRLGHQFRHDVHQATAAELDDSKLKKPVFLQLQLPDSQTVEYSRVEGNVLRTVSRRGKVLAREEFGFQPSCTVAVRQDESPKRIFLSIASALPEQAANKSEQLQSYHAVPVGLQVEATMNRDTRLTGPNIGEERVK